MGQSADPLDALLRSLSQGHQELLQPHEPQATPLTPLELAELLWLAPRLPSLASADRATPAPADPEADPSPTLDERRRELSKPTALRRPASPSDTDPLRHTRPTFFPPEPVLPPGPAAAAGLFPISSCPARPMCKRCCPCACRTFG